MVIAQWNGKLERRHSLLVRCIQIFSSSQNLKFKMLKTISIIAKRMVYIKSEEDLYDRAVRTKQQFCAIYLPVDNIYSPIKIQKKNLIGRISNRKLTAKSALYECIYVHLDIRCISSCVQFVLQICMLIDEHQYISRRRSHQLIACFAINLVGCM